MAAHAVFVAYLDEVSRSVDFVRCAVQLRPRLGEFLNWDHAGAEEKQLFGRFLGGSPIEERVYQSAFVSVCAGLEQFIADLLEEVCEVLNERKLSAADAERLFPGVLSKQRKYAGHPLDRIYEPRAHWRIAYDDLIAALETTRADSTEVRFYGRSAAVNVGAVDLASIEKAFDRLSIEVPWADICKADGLQKVLGTAAQAETRAALQRELTSMVSTRHSLAHSQGSEVVGYADIVKCIGVARELSAQLSAKVLGVASSLK